MDDFHLVLMSRAGSDHSRLSESARKLSLPLFFSQTSKTHARNPSESKKKKKDRYLPLPARVVFFPTARFERRCGAPRQRGEALGAVDIETNREQPVAAGVVAHQDIEHHLLYE